MVFGFLQHMYQYFVPDTQETVTGQLINPGTPKKSNFSAQDYVPMYDEQGRIHGYMRPPTLSMRDTKHQLVTATQSQRLSNASAPPSVPAGETLYKRTSDGGFVPINVSTSMAQSIPPPIASLPTQTGAEHGPWDGWPDGIFSRDFTLAEYEKSDLLKIHWANKASGGDRTGDEHASRWEKGKKLTRRCLGVILCDNEDCNIVIRPKTTPLAIQKQLDEACVCTAQLQHQRCEVHAISWKWAEGVHFHNDGVHAHGRPGRVLHLLNEERERFGNLVRSHPNTGPLGLIVGVPGLTGPGESAADISDVFLNADRVSKERRKIKLDADSGGDNFIAAFAKLTEEYPGFVIFSTLGKVTVICVQTKFMRTNMLKDSRMDGPVNGLVNDAAHGWWKERNSLLMITSAYSPILFRWVPGVFSYTNGASGEHFKYHFRAVFQSMAHDADERGIPIADWMFAGMMDFSEAERLGFILGFMEFWLTRPENNRTEEELQLSAERLLKGCQEHYRAGVTRISTIAGVVPPEKCDPFKARALGLLDLASSEEFIHQASLIVRDFPKLKSWMEWWMRPSHASMLFNTERIMDINIWDSIPKTNNPEEAMNWKLYAACGRDHPFLEGLRCLFAVASYYERLLAAESKGVPIRYGIPEPWKVVAANTGRTKLTRAPQPDEKKRKKNDGRPPDTKKELLKPETSKGKKKQLTLEETLPKKPEKSKKLPALKSLSQFGPPSYPWKANSCWLDTSLELMFLCAMRNFDDLSTAFDHVPSSSGLYAFYSMLNLRRLISDEVDDQTVSQALGEQRDNFRALLKDRNIVENVVSYAPLMAWFYQLIRAQASHRECFQAVLYFQAIIFDIHNCTGSPEIGGSHLEIAQPRHLQELRARCNVYETYGGRIADYFNDLISVQKHPTVAEVCWRSKDGISLCPGERVNLKDIVMSIPIILTIEVDLEKPKLVWDFPETLYPLDEPAAADNGIVYDLVGLVLLSLRINHFIARYASRDRQTIYTYDGLVRKGIPIIEHNATFGSHVAGKKIPAPKGYMVYQAFYHLRGGTKAQRQFYELRTEALQEHYNVHIIQPDPDKLPSITLQSDELVRLDPALRRAWTIKEDTYEYVSRTLTQVPVLDKDSSSQPVDETHIKSPPSPAPSLPDSEFSINCRCGLSGDGNILYRREDGEAIQCDSCNDWSHIACQSNGRANNVGKNERFLCDFCDLSKLFPPLETSKAASRSSKRIEMEARTLWNKPLLQRLRRGRGALARHGEFWYPVRVIHRESNQQWRVRWWRACEFAIPGIIADTVTTVAERDIVDSLWNDRTARRRIRLGKWTHSWDIPTSEDILADPSSVPYNNIIDDALTPWEPILRQLLEAPDAVDSADVPAKAWLKSAKKKKDISKELVPYVGSLSLTTRAQISNWFDVKIGKDKKKQREWLGRLPIAHAYTIYIAKNLEADPKRKDLTRGELLEEAWKAQFSGTPSVLMDVDVDKDCLYVFEEEMFERSARAGIAGHWQWGLDAGDHDHWDPYTGLPQYFNHGDREESESELETGPHFKSLPIEAPLVDSRPQPKVKPRPIVKKGGKRKK